MRFIDDPEAFLRRSVLVNNLLRRLRAEILLQSSDWCFPPNPAFSGGPCILPSASGPAHQALHRAVPTRICFSPQAGPPLRKRFRMVRGEQGDFQPNCCCIYAAAAGHYLHLPFSMYDAALTTCPSTPHASFLQPPGRSRSGLTAAVDGHDDDEDAEEEEEEENEEEEEERGEDDDVQRQEDPSVDAEDKLRQKSRTKTLSHKYVRTEDSSMSEGVEEEAREQEEDEDEEEEEQIVRLCPCDSEPDLHRFSFWHRRCHRQ